MQDQSIQQRYLCQECGKRFNECSTPDSKTKNLCKACGSSYQRSYQKLRGTGDRAVFGKRSCAWKLANVRLKADKRTPIRTNARSGGRG